MTDNIHLLQLKTLPMIEKFGALPSGETVHIVSIKSGRLTANLMSYGAGVQSLFVAPCDFPLVLGFDKFNDYLTYSQSYGIIAGRVANRLANANVRIDGVLYSLDKNFLDKHTLHGGTQGCGKRNWQVVNHGNDYVHFRLIQADGDMGFPATIELNAQYRLRSPAELELTLWATCDALTLCNLAHHSYFNLDGSEDTYHHQLQIFADEYLPVDGELIPTGEIRPVENSVFDFRQLKPIMTDIKEPFHYDHNFCLAAQKRGTPETAAVLKSMHSGIEMILTTTEPGLQFYSGERINSQVAGLQGSVYQSMSGVCLEPQLWPDAPNHDHFPSVLLTPNEEYYQLSSFVFG